MITPLIPSELMNPRERFNLFDEMFGRDLFPRATWWPKVDVKETKEEFRFFVELPGVHEEDVEVEMVADVLHIRGKREFASEEKRENFLRIERNYGTFHRSFTLPMEVKKEKVEALFKDGILEVIVPKLANVPAKRVPIRKN